ncbi:MAG: NAD(P)-dependent oxidoreductase [Actinobacteria bacterium]|nr:MAG: NAD(P)-dependent oxidoreductase [Actinomycetota bacterium]
MRVAVIGLGAMGSRIARRLLDAGHELVLWNRTPEKAAELVAASAKLAESPAAAARQAEVVITMVANPDALREVTEGADGIAAGVDESATVIEMSTVGPEAVERLAAALPDGVGLLDAPVLGSRSEAESGSLHVFVGGPASLYERWQPLLSHLGSPLHVGPLGSGAAAKLVANSTLFGTIGVLGEALALADALGLSRNTAFDVLSRSPLGEQAERRREAIEAGDYRPRFPISLAHKDAELVAAAAAASRIDLHLAEAARSWLADADTASWGERDYAAVVAWILEHAGLDVADEKQDQRDQQDHEQPVADGEATDQGKDDQ